MTIRSALQLSVELGLNPGSMTKLGRDIDKNVSRSLEAASKRSSSKIARGIRDAVDAGMSATQLALRSGWVRQMQNRLTQAMLSASDQFGKGLSAVQKAAAKEYATYLMRAQKSREESEKRALDRRRQAAEDLERFKQKSMEDQLESYSQGIVNAHQAVTGMDFGAAGGALRGLGGGIRNVGLTLQEEASRDDAGALQKLGGKLGAILGPMGKLVAVVGAAAGGLALLVKAFLDVESQVKDTNKAILQTGGAANLGIGLATNQSEELHKRLDMVQNVLNDMDFSKRWFTTPEMVQEVISGLAEGGTTIRMMTKDIADSASQMRAMQSATEFALTYSNLLGKSVSEISQDMGKMSFETGSSLQVIAEGFSAVHQVARMSGFEVKRFYSAVLESTTGMGMYNSRIEEAAGLLKTLSNVLGQTVGGEFLKSIQQTFSDASYRDLIKEGVLAGEGALRKNLRRDAKQQADALVRELHSLDDKQIQLIRDLFGDEGSLSSDSMFRKLSRISETQFNDMMSQMRSGGISPEFLDRFERAFDTAAGAAGKRLGDAQRAQSSVSKLIQRLEQVKTVFGGRGIEEIGGNKFQEELAAVESALGLSGAETNKLRVLMQRVAGDMRALRDKDTSPETLKKLEEQYGVVVENGRVFRAVKDLLGKVDRAASLRDKDQVSTLEDLLRSSTEFEEIAAMQGDQVSEDIKLARDISQNTNSMINVLKTGVSHYLKLIYNQVTNIWDWLWGKDDQKMARINARAMLQAGATEASAQMGRSKEEVARLQAAIEKATDPEQREKLREQLIREEKVIEQMNKFLAGNEQAQHRLSSSMDSFESDSAAIRFATGQQNFMGQTEAAEAAKGAIGKAWMSTPGGPRSIGETELANALEGSDLVNKAVSALGQEAANELLAQAVNAAVKGKESLGPHALESEMMTVMEARFADVFAEGLRKALASSDDLTRSGAVGQAEAIRAGRETKFGGTASGGYTAVGRTGKMTREDAYIYALGEGESFVGRDKRGLAEALVARAVESAFIDPSQAQDAIASIIAGDRDLEQRIRDSLIRRERSFGAGEMKVDDFIVSNGQVLRTNPQDVIMGAKGPGFGAAVAGARSGGSSPVTIYIQGGDTQKVYQVIKKVMNERRM